MKMNSGNTTVIGVDLGSSKIKVGAIVRGAPEILTNQANFRETPNVIGFGNNQRLIGEAGASKIKSNFKNTILAPHLSLGKVDSDSALYKTNQKLNPCKMEIEKNGVNFVIQPKNKSQIISAEEATAALITKIQQLVGLHELNMKHMVVSVPDYWNTEQKNSLLSALYIAIKPHSSYNYELITESEAVSLQYISSKRNGLSQAEAEAKNILFIDLGHSHFSANCFKVLKNKAQSLANTSSETIGCKFMDQLLLNYYANIFNKKHPDLDILSNKKSIVKILEAIQKQRKVLSGNNESEISIQYLIEEEDFSQSLARKNFQAIISELMDQLKQKLSILMEQLNEQGEKIDSIQLLGGGTRIPIVLQTIKEVFKLEPSRTLNSSESIAKGATWGAAKISEIFKIKNIEFINSLSNPIRYFVEQQSKGKIIFEGEKIIESNIAKTGKSLLQVELKNQSSTVYLFFGEGKEEQGTLTFTYKPKVTKSKEQMVPETEKVQLEVFINSLGDIVEIKPISKEILKLNWQIVGFHLPNEELTKLRQKEIKSAERDEEIVNSYELRNQLETYLYELKEKWNNSEGNELIKYYISPEAKKKYHQELLEVENALVQGEGLTKKTLMIKRQELQNSFEKQQQAALEKKINYQSLMKELEKLSKFLQSCFENQGKNPSCPNLPQEFVEAQEWSEGIIEAQSKKQKYQQPATSVKEVAKTYNSLQYMLQQLSQANRQRQYQQQPPGFQSSFTGPTFGNGSGYQRGFQQRRSPRNLGGGFFSDFGRFF